MTKTEFQTKAQIIFNDLFEEAFYCEEFNEELDHVVFHLGSTFASALFETTDGSMSEEGFKYLLQSFLTGMIEKFDLLDSKSEDLQIINIEES